MLIRGTIRAMQQAEGLLDLSAPPTTGERLKRARKNAALSQGEVAAAVTVEKSLVSKWETGARRPRPDQFILLAGILRVRAEDLALSPVEMAEVDRLKDAASRVKPDGKRTRLSDSAIQSPLVQLAR